MIASTSVNGSQLHWLIYKSALLSIVLLLAAGAFAQQPTVPTIRFTLNWPESEPSHYSISISADGRGVYESNGKLMADSNAQDPIRLEFSVSPTTTAHIFDLVKRANYLRGDVEMHRKLAFTGTKTLSYTDPARSVEVSYNHSSEPPIQELTALFQGFSTTLEFGRRLQYELKYQKLALEEELKKLEEASRGGQLQDLGSIAPVLQEIVDDHSTLNVVRAQAQRLLATAENHRP